MHLLSVLHELLLKCYNYSVAVAAQVLSGRWRSQATTIRSYVGSGVVTLPLLPQQLHWKSIWLDGQ